MNSAEINSLLGGREAYRYLANEKKAIGTLSAAEIILRIRHLKNAQLLNSINLSSC